MANPRISNFSKNVIRTNFENSVEVEDSLSHHSFTHLVLFIQIQSNN